MIEYQTVCTLVTAIGMATLFACVLWLFSCTEACLMRRVSGIAVLVGTGLIVVILALAGFATAQQDLVSP